ncbi:NUDIX hydrolase [Sutcliffiella halmapala]|uniref:NUDIX hydrolase n=1 Tax=Sutcliffiella halmapala TaxID=79882 RepID=UPI0009950E8D|nr:NUDIX domain-containing protein [Sutcliffiella halmapala]
MTTTYVKWGEAKVKLTWKQDIQLPTRNLITSVHGFCFVEDKLLLVNLNHRGWDIPGGHIESEETPEECCKREAMEEGYVNGDCQLLGFTIVDHNDNPKWDENSSYPKVGYQVFYRMDIKQINDFQGEFESAQRIFVNPDEILNYHHSWNEILQEILTQAVNLNK